MLFAGIEALRLLGFVSVADLVTSLTAFAGQVILGLIIFAIGLYLAILAARTVEASGAAQAGLLALAARVSILALAAQWPCGRWDWRTRSSTWLLVHCWARSRSRRRLPLVSADAKPPRTS